MNWSTIAQRWNYFSPRKLCPLHNYWVCEQSGCRSYAILIFFFFLLKDNVAEVRLWSGESKSHRIISKGITYNVILEFRNQMFFSNWLSLYWKQLFFISFFVFVLLWHPFLKKVICFTSLMTEQWVDIGFLISSLKLDALPECMSSPQRENNVCKFPLRCDLASICCH